MQPAAPANRSTPALVVIPPAAQRALPVQRTLWVTPGDGFGVIIARARE